MSERIVEGEVVEHVEGIGLWRRQWSVEKRREEVVIPWPPITRRTRSNLLSMGRQTTSRRSFPVRHTMAGPCEDEVPTIRGRKRPRDVSGPYQVVTFLQICVLYQDVKC